jgi:hypothetical protein
MVVPPARGTAPQQNASGVTKLFTFGGIENLPPSESTRRKKRLRNRTSLGDDAAEILETTTPKESNGRVTTQELRRLVEELTEVITDQTNIIKEIKADQQVLKTQNVELQEQIQSLRGQLEAISTTGTTAKTWAEVAAAANERDPTVSTRRPRKEPNCVRISTQRAPETDDSENGGFRRYLPTDMANAKIRSALLSADSTKDAQVAGIGITKTGYVIRFRDAQSAEMAQNDTTWLDELGNETKLVKPRFGVVAHRVPTEDFDLDQEKKQGIQKILIENELEEKGFEIGDIAWLRKKDRPLGRSASLGIWLNTPEAAESIITNGLLVGQRYIGSVEPYRVEMKRCHRCQRFGHLAWSCEKQARCGHCGGQHEQRHCPPGLRPRCLDCNGEHPTGDRRCQTPLDPRSSQ